METLPIQTSDLCPLNTRLLPRELSHAFGIADEGNFDSRGGQPGDQPAAAAAGPIPASAEGAPAQAGSLAGQQLKRKAPEQQQEDPKAAAAAGNVQAAASMPASAAAAAAAQSAPLHSSSSMLQGPATSQQQQATSSISAGLGLQQQAVAAVVGRQIHGYPAAYVSHPLLYGQQAVAALPHLAGMLRSQGQGL